jgi:purine-binding chemotaxis protein CheW
MTAGSGERFDWAGILARLEHSMREAEHGLDDPERRRELLRARRAALARPAPGLLEADQTDALELLVFEVAGERYALETRWVAQALALPALTPLPGLPGHVAGIAAWRGQVLAVLDLRALLSLNVERLTEPSAMVVLRDAAMEFALLADLVKGVKRYPRAALSTGAPGVLPARADYLLGVAPDRTAVLDGAMMLGDQALVVLGD